MGTNFTFRMIGETRLALIERQIVFYMSNRHLSDDQRSHGEDSLGSCGGLVSSLLAAGGRSWGFFSPNGSAIDCFFVHTAASTSAHCQVYVEVCFIEDFYD